MTDREFHILVKKSHDATDHFPVSARIQNIDASAAPVAIVAHSLVFDSHEFRVFDDQLWMKDISETVVLEKLNSIALADEADDPAMAVSIAKRFSAQHALIDQNLYVAVGAIKDVRFKRQRFDHEAPDLEQNVGLVRLDLPDSDKSDHVSISLIRRQAEVIAGKLGCKTTELGSVFTFYEVLEPELFDVNTRSDAV